MCLGGDAIVVVLRNVSHIQPAVFVLERLRFSNSWYKDAVYNQMIGKRCFSIQAPFPMAPFPIYRRWKQIEVLVPRGAAPRFYLYQLAIRGIRCSCGCAKPISALINCILTKDECASFHCAYYGITNNILYTYLLIKIKF